MDEPPVIENVEPAPKARRWLYITAGLLLVLNAGILVTFLRNVESPPTAQATSVPSVVPVQPVARPPPAPAPELARPAPPDHRDFVGRWNGWWDKAWEVHFTITRDPENGSWSVLYEWEERFKEPLRHLNYSAELVDDVLRIGPAIEMTLTDTNRAVAVGKFKKQRTARLTRDPQGIE